MFIAIQLFPLVLKCLLLHTLMKILQNKFLQLQCISATKIEASLCFGFTIKKIKIKKYYHVLIIFTSNIHLDLFFFIPFYLIKLLFSYYQSDHKISALQKNIFCWHKLWDQRYQCSYKKGCVCVRGQRECVCVRKCIYVCVHPSSRKG